MFDENFTFDTPRSPSLDSSNSPSTRAPSRSVSPCSPTTPFPAPSFSVTDLAAQFGNSRIERRAQICYDSCAAYAACDDDAGWYVGPSIDDDNLDKAPTSYSRRDSLRPARPHSPTQRSRRQCNARLLCSASHHRDIAALVARMVDSGEQCSVSASSNVAMDAEDEGYDSSSQSLTPAQSRRSSLAITGKKQDGRRLSRDTKSAGACVSKTARLRRDRNSLSRQKSA
ncbi:hypothetical protein BAUCODRAFT_391215 [Baudoinia panamericana UAMH 10762]|uniref:Uncharacterized protein n=1 Tax=Baudoinia panamericana (strain UAMH 10762) TaxID=717646 RepID=M2LWQ3_BAUPA|nr:uncharacterized protein BAUCODRAFT_391215 [Baudoinia panamericana UAMH 10762]EMC99092.1 hypothetical protein BAUCODRAFT_391215 [Baudoinia panamericana UAMH 10762]